VAAVALVCFTGTARAQSAERLALCAACHGAKGISASPQIPSLAGQPKIFVENQLVLIREGLREVPQMKGMLDGVPDTELSALASHYQALAAPGPGFGPVQADRFQRGKDLARAALCGTCHLPDYSGRQQIPRLAGQHEVFLLDTMKQFRDHAGPGRDTIMSASLLGINDAQLADLAHYLANFR
jgi:cytochrome c553